MQPRFCLLPWNVRCEGHTIGVRSIEDTVLRQAERKRVHAHATSAFPIASARIVPGTRCVKDANRKMTDRVAPKDDALIVCGLANVHVEFANDLRIGVTAIMEAPTFACWRRTKILAPST